MTAKPKIDPEVMFRLYTQGYTIDKLVEISGTKSGRNMERIILTYRSDKVKNMWLQGWGIETIMEECHANEEEIRKIIWTKD